MFANEPVCTAINVVYCPCWSPILITWRFCCIISLGVFLRTMWNYFSIWWRLIFDKWRIRLCTLPSALLTPSELRLCLCNDPNFCGKLIPSSIRWIKFCPCLALHVFLNFGEGRHPPSWKSLLLGAQSQLFDLERKIALWLYTSRPWAFSFTNTKSVCMIWCSIEMQVECYGKTLNQKSYSMLHFSDSDALLITEFPSRHACSTIYSKRSLLLCETKYFLVAHPSKIVGFCSNLGHC